MPIGEIAGEVVGGIARLVGHILVEFVFEIMVRGLGYVVWRRVSPHTNPDGLPSVLVGILIWIAVVGLGYALYQEVAAWLAIGRCLDAGGTYDHNAGLCVHG